MTNAEKSLEYTQKSLFGQKLSNREATLNLENRNLEDSGLILIP